MNKFYRTINQLNTSIPSFNQFNSITYSSNPSSSFIPLSSFLINDLYNYPNDNIIKSGGCKLKYVNKYQNVSTTFYTNLPEFFKRPTEIKIPKKVRHTLTRLIPKSLLKKINTDIDVSIEKCLLFTTHFSSTFFEGLENGIPGGWKTLKSEYLQDYFYNAPQDYINIINVLKFKTAKGPIIECDNIYKVGHKSYGYRLGEAYRKKGITDYVLKTDTAIGLAKKNYERIYYASKRNDICQNLMHFYPTITLPNQVEILIESKKLIQKGFRTKKGKILKSLNKCSRESYKLNEAVSWVEDDLKLFLYLTESGLMPPSPGSNESGGRIVDSFTLMPSWIRNIITVDGEHLVECDYSCLHPNIAVALYGGNQKYITHSSIAASSGLDQVKVKRQHLSFFNEKVQSMRHYEVYDYYQQTDPIMLKRIIDEKNQSIYGYKITSRRLFKKEVEIMTDVIRLLNQECIYVLYVYDALMCQPKYAERVVELMNMVILKHGIKTIAKPSVWKT